MTYRDFIDAVAMRLHGHTRRRAEVKRALEAAFAVLREEALGGGRVPLPGFGVFAQARRKERRIRNPVTRELMLLDEVVSVQFRAAKAAKEKVR